MKLFFRSHSIRHAAAILLLGSITGVPAGLLAATATNDAGVRLLQAQLPTGTNIPQTNCDQLARAVGRATLTHRSDAPAILTAALSNGAARTSELTQGKRSCACVTHIFRVSIAAAPAQTSALLETATALYPDCADAFAAAVDHNDDKNVVDDKNGPARRHPAPSDTRTASTNSSSTGPATADTDPGDPSLPGDLTDRDNTGLGFGGGFGPGFPGSPGFTGSPPSGGIALPIPSPETSVVNG